MVKILEKNIYLMESLSSNAEDLEICWTPHSTFTGHGQWYLSELNCRGKLPLNSYRFPIVFYKIESHHQLRVSILETHDGSLKTMFQ